MADQGLKIVVSADTSDAVAGLKQVSSAGQATGVVFTGVAEKANQAGTAFKSSAVPLKAYGSALQDARDKVDTFRAKLELLNKDALTGSVGKNLAKDLQLATGELKNLEKQAGITGDSTGNAFQKAFSGIRQIAYILPGIGVAGIFNLIGEGLINLINHTTELTEAQKEQQKAQDSIVSKTADESARVEVLVKALQSGTLSRQQTKGAIEELKQIAPAYFGLLDKEKASVTDITAAYNSYNNALVKTIEAQIKQGELTELIKKRLEIQSQFKDADAFVKSALDAGKSLNDLSKELATEDTEKSIRQSVTATDALGAAIRITNKDVLDKVTADQKANQTTTQRIAGVKALVAALLAEQNTLASISVSDLKIKEDPIKETKDKLEKEKILIPAEIKLPENQADLIRRGLESIDFTDVFKKGIKDVPVIQFNVDTQKAIAALDDLRDHLAIVKKATDDFKSKVGSALSSLAADSIAQIGTAIGDLISGDGLQGAVKGLLTILGDGLITIGKYVIEYAITIGAIKKAIDVLLKAPGGVAIAIGLGIAAIALGTILKNKVANSTKFADGGIVTGPTQALIGEAGPEVVFPLNKISQFMNGVVNNNNSTNINLAGQFRLNKGDLLLAVNQAVVSRGRGVR